MGRQRLYHSCCVVVLWVRVGDVEQAKGQMKGGSHYPWIGNFVGCRVAVAGIWGG